MRILLLPFPAAKSHVFHLTPIAWALRTAGHQVRVAGSPDLAEDIAHSGLTGVSYGRPMFEALTEVDEQSEPPKEERRRFPPGVLPVQGDYVGADPTAELAFLTESFLQHAVPEESLADLVAFAREWRPDLVIGDQLAPVGGVVARACGAAYARFLWGADALAQLWQAAAAQREGTDRPDPLREWLAPLVRAHGGDYDDGVITGDWSIDTTPAWSWRPPGLPYVRVRHVPFNGPATVPGWLRDRPARPRVAITLGVTIGDSGLAEASAADLLDAVADLDAEVVALLGEEQLGSATVPDNVRVVDFAPLNVLLPSCAAIVHHGGAGTLAAALEHGVPQLVVPSAYWDTMWWGPVAFATGLVEQGAGAYVAADSDHLTPDALRESLTRVLKDPSYGRNAARLSALAQATPTPNDIVPALEKLTARHADLHG